MTIRQNLTYPTYQSNFLILTIPYINPKEIFTFTHKYVGLLVPFSCVKLRGHISTSATFLRNINQTSTYETVLYICWRTDSHLDVWRNTDVWKYAVCWKYDVCWTYDVCWHNGHMLTYGWMYMLTYALNYAIWTKYQHMNSYYAIWTLCRHTKQYCTLHIRTSKYGLKFCNMNYMSKYETILHITNPCVGIWTHIEQYELYVAIWNNTAYYKPICRHKDLYCTI